MDEPLVSAPPGWPAPGLGFVTDEVSLAPAPGATALVSVRVALPVRVRLRVRAFVFVFVTLESFLVALESLLALVALESLLMVVESPVGC